ncbi:hypothetical protein ASZ78_010023 [Callipepla squamata]|uniref:SMB domain-containing protein n=1 Tax=Callipepla squamata TaxID=9009 RepID=A0A226NLS6_CALSU|nr:hypothetical protein ASZ78_010023 [Callipepla squamata]
MDPHSEIGLHQSGHLDEMILQPMDYVKKKTLQKYKIICAVLLIALVAVSLGLGLGLGLNRGAQEQVSCRHKCNKPYQKEVAGCQCDSGCKERQDCCWDYEDACVEPTRSWSCTNFRCGETRLPGSYCSCSDDCLQENDCCVNYNTVCKDLICHHLSFSQWMVLEQNTCKLGVLCCQILKNSMAQKGSCGAKELTHLIANDTGSQAREVRNGYWGLYPESHGIVDNNMYDVDLNKHFSLSSTEKFRSSWWKGQPMWLTAMHQGLKAGTFFWPGSDVPINDTYPNFFHLYNGSVAYEERISGILNWLDKTKSERPDFYTLYIEEPDSSGHSFGPVSGGVIKALQLADQSLGMLMEGLKQRNLHNCVNLIVLADHGMDMTYCSQLEYMSNYFDQINFYIYAGPAARIRASVVPQNYYTFDSEGIVKNLTCKRSPQHFKPYLSPNLPKRLHYANNIRIDKVHLLVDRQWLAVRDNSYTFCDQGNHGYDNEFKSMEAIFLAYGPSFKEKTEVDAFENIEVYNLMCDLLQITPAPNNGTHGSLNHLLKKPFYNPSHANEESSPASCPLSHLTPIDELGCTCKEESTSSLPPTVSDCLRADVRIPIAHSQNCSNYPEGLDLTYGFLYPPNFNSSAFEQYDALLTSNIVPMYRAFKDIWDYFHDVLLQKYARERNGVNVISGPVFDYNYDGHFDTLDEITQHVNNTQIPIPTHYFVVLTSCKDTSNTPLNCTGSLDALPFIIPHRPDNTESCADNRSPSEWVEERVQAHSARVRDVELLTGLDFYQERQESVSEILQLKTFLPTFETEIN